MKSDGIMPKRATKSSAGYDFCTPERIEVKAGEKFRIDTGVRFDGTERADWSKWVMFIFPRSSLGMKYGFRLTNTVGIIDMDYRDNIVIEAVTDTDVVFEAGERVAQGVIVSYGQFSDEIEPEMERKGGMGSTGRM